MHRIEDVLAPSCRVVEHVVAHAGSAAQGAASGGAAGRHRHLLERLGVLRVGADGATRKCVTRALTLTRTLTQTRIRTRTRTLTSTLDLPR